MILFYCTALNELHFCLIYISVMNIHITVVKNMKVT
jgi:hypothetical protein